MASAIESGSPVAAAGVLVPTRRPAALWSEPYRAFFLFGSIYGSIVFALWGWQLLALGQGAALSGFSLSAAGHVRLVLWGVLGSYVFGFSLTAYPKQNDGDLLAPRPLQAIFALFAVSQITGLAAALLGSPVLERMGWAGLLASHAVLLGKLAPVGLRSLRAEWNWQPLSVLVALGTGTLALAATGIGFPAASWAGTSWGLWGYLCLLAAAFGYRVIPFFASRVVPGYTAQRGKYFLPFFIALLWSSLILRALGRHSWYAAAQAGLFVLCAREMLRWAPHRVWRVPVLWVLYLAWMWMLLAFAAGALSQGIGATVSQTHLLTAGALVTFLFGISSRVTLGHSGRPLDLGWSGTGLLGLVQAAAIVRICGAHLWPEARPQIPLAASAFVLAGAFALWALRFGPYLVLPKRPPPKACPR